MATLWASAEDRRRLGEAGTVLFLVGSYDGSGNYGDVLQLATAIETANALPGTPLAVPIVEHETREHHETLMRRFVRTFDGAAFAFFRDQADDPGDGLVELTPSPGGQAGKAIYAYGGGYMNFRWGARKVAHAEAAQQLAGDRALPVIASGQQVDEATIASDGVAHELLGRASWIGLRDRESLESVQRQIPGASDRAKLAGDDALPFLERQQTEASAVVNLHVNDGTWISDRPESMQAAIVALLREIGAASGEPLALQPLIAYEDPRVSERRIVAELFAHGGEELEQAGLTLGEPLDLLEDAIDNGLAAFRRARLTVSCSYHVTLTSLLAGIPVLLLAQNDYYAQKAAGLRDLFALGPELVGVPGTPDDASAAVEALTDGPGRDALTSHLRTQSRQVAARFRCGRAALSAALTDALRLAGLEAELELARRRADEAERELAAVHATRGWRVLDRLRAVRDMMR